MAHEVVDTKCKKKLYEMPFVGRINDKPVVRFIKYNQYDRREAL